MSTGPLSFTRAPLELGLGGHSVQLFGEADSRSLQRCVMQAMLVLLEHETGACVGRAGGLPEGSVACLF